MRCSTTSTSLSRCMPQAGAYISSQLWVHAARDHSSEGVDEEHIMGVHYSMLKWK